MQRRAASLVVFASVALALVGCTSTPAPVDSASQKWLDHFASLNAGRQGLQGGLGAVMTDAAPKGQAVVGYANDKPQVKGFELSCLGGGSATFQWTIKGHRSQSTGEKTAECTGDNVVVVMLDTPTSAADKVTMTVKRAKGSPVAAHADVLGSTTSR